jgi:hypothetical protein
MTADDKLPAGLREAVRDLAAPPPVPRDALWARIEAARGARRPPRRSARMTELIRWTLPLAATLALGVALGRSSVRDRAPAPAFVEAGPTAGQETGAGRPTGADPGAGPALPYVVAAVQHLVRTEALLTSLPEDARLVQVEETAAWARDLLANTRLLMTSPASADPQLAALLQDLELILAQIAALPTAPPAQELRLIEDGIARNDVIGRLRAATTERPFAGT